MAGSPPMQQVQKEPLRALCPHLRVFHACARSSFNTARPHLSPSSTFAPTCIQSIAFER